MTAFSPLRAPIHLPGRLGRRIDALAEQTMSPPGLAIDFSAPRGGAAMAEPGSVCSRVVKSPSGLTSGGVAAVLLELAEPGVREGVWQHSRFRQDALTRLQRTGLAGMVTVYGPRRVAEKMIAG